MIEPDDFNDAEGIADRGMNTPNSSTPQATTPDGPALNTNGSSSSHLNHSVQKPVAAALCDSNDNPSTGSLERLESSLSNLSSDHSTSPAHQSAQFPEALGTERINDNTSDVSLEPIEEGLDSLFGAFSTTTKTKTKSKRKSKRNKKKAGTTTSNALYSMLKDMAAGKSEPSSQPVDESLLAWTSNLLASIPVTGNTFAPSHQTDTEMDESLLNYTNDLLSSIPVGSSSNGGPSESLEGKETSNGKTKSSVSDHVRKIIGGLPIPLSMSKSKKSKGRKKLAKLRRLEDMKKIQKKSTNDIDSMDDEALLEYAMKQSLIDHADEESLSGMEAKSNGNANAEERINSSSNKVVGDLEEDGRIQGHSTVGPTPTLPHLAGVNGSRSLAAISSGFPRLNGFKGAARGDSAFTATSATFVRPKELTRESSSYRKAENNSRNFPSSQGHSTCKSSTDKMDIDTSVATIGRQSPLGIQEVNENASTPLSDLVLQNNTQASLRGSSRNSTHLNQNNNLAPPISTNSTPDNILSLAALTMDPNIPHPPFKFTRLPLTVRNSIYKLLVLSPFSYATTSPRKPRELRANPHTPSANTAVFLVNKLVSEESRAIFYAHNVFKIGNDRWGCTLEANLHGFQTFASIVPKQFKSMIKTMEMKIMVPTGWLGVNMEGDDRDFEELRLQEKLVGLGILMGEEFTGVTSVDVSFWIPEWDQDHVRGNRAPYGRSARIAVSREDKLNTLYDLVNLPFLENFHIGSRGPLEVKVEFAKIVKYVIDVNKADGRVPYNNGEQLPQSTTEEQAGFNSEAFGESGFIEDGDQAITTQYGGDEARQDGNYGIKTQDEDDDMEDGGVQLHMQEIEYADDPGNGGMLDQELGDPYMGHVAGDDHEDPDIYGEKDISDPVFDDGFLSEFGIDQ